MLVFKYGQNTSQPSEEAVIPGGSAQASDDEGAQTRAHARAKSAAAPAHALAQRLNKTIVLVGLMGAGKSCVGKRLAACLGLPFVDADREIEAAAGGCSISDIFAIHGEKVFRDGERRVIQRLLGNPMHVLATGGGAFIDPSTRALIKDKAISVWLQGRARPAAEAHRPAQRPAAAAECRSARQAGRADRPALPGLCRGRPHGRERGRAAGRHRAARLARHRSGTRRRVERDQAAMTIIDRSAIDVVRVDLGTRSYDIKIGGGLVARAGEMIAPAVKQKRAVIVTDAQVARLYLDETPALAARRRHRQRGDRAASRRSDQELRRAGSAVRPAAGPEGRALDHADRARRRRDRRPDRLRRCRRAARHRVHPDSRPPCWRRSIPRSAARPASTRRRART